MSQIKQFISEQQATFKMIEFWVLCIFALKRNNYCQIISLNYTLQGLFTFDFLVTCILSVYNVHWGHSFNILTWIQNFVRFISESSKIEKLLSWFSKKYSKKKQFKLPSQPIDIKMMCLFHTVNLTLLCFTATRCFVAEQML